MGRGEDHRQHHVVLFPFMAKGHITPFLHLADLIHRRSPTTTITFVNTPANIRSVSSSLPSNSTLRLRSLPFDPSEHGLPRDAETAATLPVHHFINLFHASESLRPAFDHLLSDIASADGRPPVCVISDYFLGWTVESARTIGSLHSVFSTCGAYGITVYRSLWLYLPHRNKSSNHEFPLLDFPEVVIHKTQLPRHLLAADGKDQWSVFLQRQMSYWHRSDSMLINTVREFETKGMAMLQKAVAGVPIFPIGALLPGAAKSSSSSSSSSKTRFVEWLEGHPPDSVLYVSFGSQNTISLHQMMELAMGLEASGQPFIWAVRPPLEFDIREEFRAEWLPEGFEERGRGMVVKGWVPQMEILSHPSTGAFLSHCGWNSTLESLSQGVPIIGWPLAGDQPYNAKMLDEEGLCVEVARGNGEDTRVERGEVESVIRVVMGETEKGREMRRRAAEVAEMMASAWREEDGGGGAAVMGSSLRGWNEFWKNVSREMNPLRGYEPALNVESTSL